MSLAACTLLAGCGSSSGAEAKVRATYSRLLHALASNDAATVCELMLPANQNQSRSALIAAAHRLATPSVAAEYKRYVTSTCPPAFRDEPQNMSGYYGLLRGSRLGAISINGPIATAAVTARNGRHESAIFLDAAGEWRLVIGVD
ncbi:MAG TPA: hypothetical protein VHT27_02310 [Solirubrobacteraceae bacterium]|nr:hypothetical protein [Solirubrobacteraceae bacterium]